MLAGVEVVRSSHLTVHKSSHTCVAALDARVFSHPAAEIRRDPARPGQKERLLLAVSLVALAARASPAETLCPASCLDHRLHSPSRPGQDGFSGTIRALSKCCFGRFFVRLLVCFFIAAVLLRIGPVLLENDSAGGIWLVYETWEVILS